MSTKLTVERGAANYERPRSVIREIAARYNRSPGGVSQDLYGAQGCFRKAEDRLTDLVQFGAVELAQKQVNRFIGIVTNRPAKPLTPALVLEAVAADSNEDVARAALREALADSDPSNDEPARREFVRRARTAIAKLSELCDAVEAGLTK